MTISLKFRVFISNSTPESMHVLSLASIEYILNNTILEIVLLHCFTNSKSLSVYTFFDKATICSSDSNEIRTRLVRKRTLNHLAKLA